MSEKPKPCPFCGGTDIAVMGDEDEERETPWRSCRTCTGNADPYTWNERADPTVYLQSTQERVRERRRGQQALDWLKRNVPILKVAKATHVMIWAHDLDYDEAVSIVEATDE